MSKKMFIMCMLLLLNMTIATTIYGILTIESGLGPGAYSGGHSGLHGIWPSNSTCIKAQNTLFDTENISSLCNYINDPNDNYWFARHEWYKHGIYAGGPGPASAFFQMACNLSQPIVTLLSNIDNWNHMKKVLLDHNTMSQYLFHIDENNKQFLFSIRSENNGYNWNLYSTKLTIP